MRPAPTTATCSWSSGHQFVHPTGLADLQLGQLNGRRADRHGPGAEIGFGPHPLAGAHRLVEQAVENRAEGAVFLPEPHHLLHLGEDLALAQHQRVEAGSHPQQVSNGIFMMKGEEMRAELIDAQAGMPAEEGAHCRDALVGMPQQGIDLQPVAGAEDGGLQHLVIGAQLLE